MKKIIMILASVFLAANIAFAFLYDLEILDIKQIAELSDESLLARFMEAKIEEKASGEFHRGAGFSSAKDYNKRKDLLRYVIFLRREMSKRKLEADPIDEWLM